MSGSQVSLLVAALDLAEVRLLRSAIRVADIQGARGAARGQPEPVIEPRRHFHPDPVIEPAHHIHPPPRFEPRPVLRPLPTAAPCPPSQCPDREYEVPVTVTREDHLSPLQPPWKVLPWEQPAKPASVVKVVIYRSDVIHKGSLIDFFL